MSRRVSLPGASELFRPTETASEEPSPAPDELPDAEEQAETTIGTGRVRHDEKFTVYVSREELLALEEARFSLRRDHDLGVDRGRIVRAALAVVLDDFAARGAQSALVDRLQEQ